jgi:hypothetical protein
MKQYFAPLAQSFSTAWAANAADRTTQAVRYWAEGERAPDSAALLNLATDRGDGDSRSDQVWEFICWQTNRPFDPYGSMEEQHAYTLLHQIAAGEGPQAEWARSILRKSGGWE